MICMRNVRIFRIKRGRFLKFSKTKENCLASNKYIPKNSIIFSHLRILTFHRTSMRVKLKKKKRKESRKTSPRIFLLEFTNEPLLGLILKIKKKKRRGKKKKKLSFRCRVKNRRNPPDSKRLG